MMRIAYCRPGADRWPAPGGAPAGWDVSEFPDVAALEECLRDRPADVLQSDYFKFDFKRADAIEAPLAYLGGPLLYWQKSDPAIKAAQSFLRFAERLALQHGRLIDEVPPARTAVDAWNAKRDFVF